MLPERTSTAENDESEPTLFLLGLIVVLIVAIGVCLSVDGREDLAPQITAAVAEYERQLEAVKQARRPSGEQQAQLPLVLVVELTAPHEEQLRQSLRSSVALQRALLWRKKQPPHFRHVFVFGAAEVQAEDAGVQQQLAAEAAAHGDVVIVRDRRNELLYYTAVDRLQLLYDWLADSLPPEQRPAYVCVLPPGGSFVFVPALIELLQSDSEHDRPGLWLERGRLDAGLDASVHLLSYALAVQLSQRWQQLGVEARRQQRSWSDVLAFAYAIDDVDGYAHAAQQTGDLRLSFVSKGTGGCSEQAWAFVDWKLPTFDAMLHNLLVGLPRCHDLRVAHEEKLRQAEIHRRAEQERRRQLEDELRRQNELAARERAERKKKQAEEHRLKQEAEVLAQLKQQIRERADRPVFVPDQLRNDDPLQREEIRRQLAQGAKPISSAERREYLSEVLARLRQDRLERS